MIDVVLFWLFEPIIHLSGGFYAKLLVLALLLHRLQCKSGVRRRRVCSYSALDRIHSLYLQVHLVQPLLPSSYSRNESDLHASGGFSLGFNYFHSFLIYCSTVPVLEWRPLFCLLLIHQFSGGDILYQLGSYFFGSYFLSSISFVRGRDSSSCMCSFVICHFYVHDSMAAMYQPVPSRRRGHAISIHQSQLFMLFVTVISHSSPRLIP
jgi:hypothetical protein